MATYEEVVARLKECGVEVGADKKGAVTDAIFRSMQEIFRQTNLTTVPDGLHFVHVDMATGYFLQDYKASGGSMGDQDSGAVVKRITEGDVSVEFSESLSPEASLDNMIKALSQPPQSTFAAFRRMKW